MSTLSPSMMNDIPAVVPMWGQQSQFVSFVEQIDKSKYEIQKNLEKLETLETLETLKNIDAKIFWER